MQETEELYQETAHAVARLMVCDDAEAGCLPLLLPLLCTAVILVGVRWRSDLFAIFKGFPSTNGLRGFDAVWRSTWRFETAGITWQTCGDSVSSAPNSSRPLEDPTRFVKFVVKAVIGGFDGRTYDGTMHAYRLHPSTYSVPEGSGLLLHGLCSLGSCFGFPWCHGGHVCFATLKCTLPQPALPGR